MNWKNDLHIVLVAYKLILNKLFLKKISFEQTYRKKEKHIKGDIRWIRKPSVSYLGIWIMCCKSKRMSITIFKVVRIIW